MTAFIYELQWRMSKPDKYPYIDPNQRGVFDVIIRTVAEMRKRQKSESWRLEQQRIALSEKTRREARELEARAEEARRISLERAKQRPEPEPQPVIQYRDEKGTLVLKESGMPKFVR